MKKILTAAGQIAILLKAAEDSLIEMGFYNIAFEDVLGTITASSKKYGSVVLEFAVPETNRIGITITCDDQFFIDDFKTGVNRLVHTQGRGV